MVRNGWELINKWKGLSIIHGVLSLGIVCLLKYDNWLNGFLNIL
ncbi:hypothetical protein OIU76_001149 [Salix suchowensis]|nr:hypothetical protein OIU76_001149 [Salix suchowensis]